MTQVTLKLPSAIATNASRWLPTVLSLNLIEYKTPAATVASEIIRFLLNGPTPHAILDHHPSAEAEERIRRLLTLNSAGLLGPNELRELDELEKIENIMSLAKLDIVAAEQLGRP